MLELSGRRGLQLPAGRKHYFLKMHSRRQPCQFCRSIRISRSLYGARPFHPFKTPRAGSTSSPLPVLAVPRRFQRCLYSSSDFGLGPGAGAGGAVLEACFHSLDTRPVRDSADHLFREGIGSQAAAPPTGSSTNTVCSGYVTLAMSPTALGSLADCEQKTFNMFTFFRRV